MDGPRLGAIARAIRIRKALRQSDLARLARVSRDDVSRLERGRLRELRIDVVVRIFEALGGRLDLVPRWQGGDLDRLLNARHAAMHESVARWFLGLAGWEIAPEVSFAIRGERGVVDILAWHAGTRTLLVIELKTEIVDVSDLMARSIASDGWRLRSCSSAAGSRQRSRSGCSSPIAQRIVGASRATRPRSAPRFPATAG